MCADWIACWCCFLVDYYCDPGETRTPDNSLRRRVLYPLSYGVNKEILSHQAVASLYAPTRRGGHPGVAIRAPHRALRNLLGDLFPGRSTANHARDFRSFFAKMVEVQQSDVLFTAINAWMLGQVLVNARGQ